MVEISLVYPNIMIYGDDGSSMTQDGASTPGQAADWLRERPKELGSRFEIWWMNYLDWICPNRTGELVR